MKVRAYLVATAAILLAALPALAQVRTIPAEARRGELRHLQETMVELNGRPAQLAPAAQIRDQNNLIVLPASLPPRSLVKYTLNAQGQLFRVWILTATEAAQPDRDR